MMNVTCVTTFHEPGLKQYGQRFIDSFSKQVDPQIKLIVYAEKCHPISNDPRIEIRDADNTLPDLQTFKRTWKDVPKANGKCPWPARRPRDNHKEFKWDAVRFANKVFCVTHALKNSQNFDYIIWLDADTYSFRPMPKQFLQQLLPNNTMLTYLGRENPDLKDGGKDPECGFVGYNLNHTEIKNYIFSPETALNNPYLFESSDNLLVISVDEIMESKLQNFSEVADSVSTLLTDDKAKEKIIDKIGKNLKTTTSPILILLFVGALAGTWLISGIIPAMIYYGLKIINPSLFLPSCIFISAIVSIMLICPPLRIIFYFGNTTDY